MNVNPPNKNPDPFHHHRMKFIEVLDDAGAIFECALKMLSLKMPSLRQFLICQIGESKKNDELQWRIYPQPSS